MSFRYDIATRTKTHYTDYVSRLLLLLGLIRKFVEDAEVLKVHSLSVLTYHLDMFLDDCRW